MAQNGVTNLSGFDDFIDEASEEITGDAMDVVVKLGLDLMTKVVKKTPVDTGRARGGWGMNWGSPANVNPGAQIDVEEDEWTESEARGQVGSEAEKIALERPAAELAGQKLHISNNVNYVKYLEQGKPGPGSDQAPQGMVATSIEELKVEN